MTIIDRDMLGLVFDIERFLVTIFGLDYLYETCAFSFCYPRGRFGQSLFKFTLPTIVGFGNH